MYEILILFLLFALVEFISLLITGIFFLPKKIVHLSTKLQWIIYAIGILPLYLYPVYFIFLPFNLTKPIFALTLVIYLLASFFLYRLLNKAKAMFKAYYQNNNDEKTCQTRLNALDNIKSVFVIGILVFIFLFYYSGYLNLLFV